MLVALPLAPERGGAALGDALVHAPRARVDRERGGVVRFREVLRECARRREAARARAAAVRVPQRVVRARRGKGREQGGTRGQQTRVLLFWSSNGKNNRNSS